MTADMMLRYLGSLRESLDDRERTMRIHHVLMEIYLAQITESVRFQMRLLGFNGHLIPSGLTGKYQLLDRSMTAA
jgi:hypothetical protein